MALIARGYPSKTGNKDILITMFNELMDEYPTFRSYIPKVAEEIVQDILNKLNMKVKSQLIVDLVMKRYNLIVN